MSSRKLPTAEKVPGRGVAEEVVEAEPIGAFNRDPMDLVVTTGDGLVVNHLLEHDFLSHVQCESLLEDLEGVPLSEKAPISNENPPIVGRPKDLGTRRTVYGNLAWGKGWDGGFLRVPNPYFFRWFAPKLRLGGCSRNCALTRGSAPHPRTPHPK